MLWFTGLAVKMNWATVNQVVMKFERTELLEAADLHPGVRFAPGHPIPYL